MLQYNNHSNDVSQRQTIATAIIRSLQTWIKTTIIDDDPDSSIAEREEQLWAQLASQFHKGPYLQNYTPMDESEDLYLVQLRSYIVNPGNL